MNIYFLCLLLLGCVEAARTNTRCSGPTAERQKRHPHEKGSLLELYQELKHYPLLHSQRLAVVPSTEVDQRATRKERTSSAFQAEVGKRAAVSTVQACPSESKWIKINHARSINSTWVEIYQPTKAGTSHHLGRQWFYITKCTKSSVNQSCTGIDTSKYSSKCIETDGFVVALAKSGTQADFEWTWIQVPSDCSCVVSPSQ